MSPACPRCRTQNPPGARVCRNCGETYEPETRSLAAGAPSPEAARPPAPVAPAVAAPAASLGDALFAGKYRILRELGRGGMGIVYEAEQQSPKRAVALKVIRGGSFVSETEVRMFQREAQALARLKHPHIAPIYESGRTEDGRHYFAMELVSGRTLAEHLALLPDGDRPALTSADIRLRLRLFRKVCDAVGYAHQRGIIHRDLKPSNIIVQSGSEAPVRAADPVPEVKILDFGLARITEADLAASALVSEAGLVMGTVPYMSPEQIRGDADAIDVRSDVYALGVILYEMLAGRLPYDLTRASLPTMARTIVETPPRPLARGWLGARKPDADLQTIVAKVLEKEPERRYQSAGALSDDIERYLKNEPIAARPASGLYQLRKLIARHKVGFGFVAASVVVLAGFALAMTLLSARIARERTRAEKEAATAGAINDFLLETMGSANPVEGSGRDTTVLEALDAAVAKIGPSFKGQPDVEMDLRQVIGQTYLRLGRYGEAEDLLASACRIAEATYGPEHHYLSSPLTALAVLKHERGAHAEAESFYRRALAIQRATGARDTDADVLSILNNLALVLQDQGKLDEAEPIMRQVLAADRETLGEEDVNVALDHNNLGTLLLDKGDVAAAEPVLRRAVDLFEKAGHPWRSFAKGGLARLLGRKGDRAAADALFVEALPAALADFGGDNLDVAKLRWKYGNHLLDLARYAEAEPQLREAFRVFDGSLGAESDWTRRAAGDLARVYDAMDRTEDARRFREWAGPAAGGLR